MKTYAKPTIYTVLILLLTICIGVNSGYSQTSEKALKEVDETPEFPGGMDALFNFMGENLKYPEAAQKKGIEGTVVVAFVVKKDGSIESPEILRGIGAGCDEEAIRVVKSFPNWIPGEKDGEKVNTQMQLPVKYKL